MFQNISGSYQDDTEYDDIEFNKKQNKLRIIIKKFFTKQNVALYILSFMVSTVNFGQGIAPFGLAILAACCSNSIPIGIIYLITCIGSLIGVGKSGFLVYILISLVFIGLTLIFRTKTDEISDRKKFGVQLAISCLLVQTGKMFFETFLVYDFLQGIMYTILVCVFYKIFSGSINVIRDFGIKKAFSIEEVLGASLIIAIAIAGFKDITIFNFGIKNILSILLVLIMGWQNGVLVGATSGITIGVVLGIIGNGDPIMIAAYALSGMIAGILNKLGKIGVVVGFIIGNILLSYFNSGTIVPVILFQEILIASIGLLALPKGMRINIEDTFKNTKCLPTPPEKALEQSKDVIEKLNGVSEAIFEVANSYKESAATVVEEETVELENSRNRIIFEEELRNNIQDLEENILYEDMLEEESSVIEDLFNRLIEKDYIEKQDLLEILENHNNYIIGFDDPDINKKINKDIEDIEKAINYSYRVNKINFVWEKKIDDNKQTMKTQLDGISKAISSIADDMTEKKIINKDNIIESQKEEIQNLLQVKGIYVLGIDIEKEKSGKVITNIYLEACKEDKIKECNDIKIGKIVSKVFNENMVLQQSECSIQKGENSCKLTYISEDKYTIALGIAKKTKNKSVISGDSSLQIRLEDGKQLLAISDGMGSGVNANKSSKTVIKMLRKLLLSGFQKEISIDLINSSLCLNAKNETYATLDIAILDLYKGNVEFIKNGACPTFIKNRKNVDIIKVMSLPAGILNDIELTVYDRDIENNDILVMCSDGILESNSEFENKELWVKYILENIETDNVQKIADILLGEAIDNGVGIAKDDMTVIVAKLIKK